MIPKKYSSLSQKILPVMMMITILNVFSGCTHDAPRQEENIAPLTPEQQKNSGVSSEKISEKTASLVVIPERCISCRKCYNIDPEHFIEGGSNGKAIVISQENLSSSQLAFAKRACPTDAIQMKTS